MKNIQKNKKIVVLAASIQLAVSLSVVTKVKVVPVEYIEFHCIQTPPLM